MWAEARSKRARDSPVAQAAEASVSETSEECVMSGVLVGGKAAVSVLMLAFCKPAWGLELGCPVNAGSSSSVQHMSASGPELKFAALPNNDQVIDLRSIFCDP